MQKKLLALAVAGAFAAPFAAQAADNVTIYGVLDAAVANVEAKGSAVVGAEFGSRTVLTSNSSRLGFKGEEDLGGGLKGWFQIESSINVDGAAGGLNGRNTAVGLKGGWGNFFVGQWDTPSKTFNVAMDPWATGLPHQAAILQNNGIVTGAAVGAVGSTNSFHTRQANVIQYWTPKMGGFEGRISYVPTEGENQAGTQSPSNLGLSATWEGMGAFLGATYEKRDEAGLVVVAGAPVTLDDEYWSIGGKYTFGAFTVGAYYEHVEIDTTATAAGTQTAERDSWMLNAIWKIGNGAVKIAYVEGDDVEGNNAAFARGMPGVAGIGGNIASTKAQQFTIGYDHSLSKRTTVYVYYTQIDNDAGSAFTFGTQGGTSVIQSVLGNDPEAFGVGVKHTF